MNLKIGKKFIILIFALLASAMIVSGCSDSMSEEKLREQGYICATFDCNGGLLDNRTERDFYYLPGSAVLEPGLVPIKIKLPVREGYDIGGWYLPETDTDGNVLKNTDGTVILGEAWDFSTPIYEDITLYAKWVKKLRILYVNVSGGRAAATAEGEVAGYSELAYNETFRLPETLRWTGHTFLAGYYLSPESFAAGEKLDRNTFTLRHDGTLEEYKIYTEWLDGDYILVHTAADMSTIYKDRNYYLLDDITFDENNAWIMPAEFGGEILGNGKTISGIKLDTLCSVRIGRYYGIFGILSNAKIQDVTFDNCDIRIRNTSQSNSVNAGLLAGSISGKTVFDRVTVNGVLKLEYYTDYMEYRPDGLAGFLSTDIGLDGCMLNITVTPTVLG